MTLKTGKLVTVGEHGPELIMGHPKRKCEQCKEDMPKGMRAHARFCSPACRSLNHYYRKEYGPETSS